MNTVFIIPTTTAVSWVGGDYGSWIIDPRLENNLWPHNINLRTVPSHQERSGHVGQMGKVDVLYDLRQVFCFINSIFWAWLHLLGTRLAVDLKRYSKTYIAGISGLTGLARQSLGSWSFKGVHHYCTRGILILMNFRISILAC